MEVKGTAVVVIPPFVKKVFQESGYAKWLQALSPAAHEVFTRPILPSQWYDYQTHFLEPTLKLCELFYGGNAHGAFELGRFSADYALQGIYKVFVRIGSTDFILKKGATIISTYYRPSRMEVPLADSKRAVLRILEFPELHAVVEERIAGWISRALEISGAKGVKVTIAASLAKKASYTEYAVTWD